MEYNERESYLSDAIEIGLLMMEAGGKVTEEIEFCTQSAAIEAVYHKENLSPNFVYGVYKELIPFWEAGVNQARLCLDMEDCHHCQNESGNPCIIHD